MRTVCGRDEGTVHVRGCGGVYGAYAPWDHTWRWYVDVGNGVCAASDRGLHLWCMCPVGGNSVRCMCTVLRYGSTVPLHHTWMWGLCAHPTQTGSTVPVHHRWRRRTGHVHHRWTRHTVCAHRTQTGVYGACVLYLEMGARCGCTVAGDGIQGACAL